MPSLPQAQPMTSTVKSIDAMNNAKSNEQQAGAIVQKMDSTGIPFIAFLNVFSKMAQNSRISIGQFLIVAKSAYPKVNETEQHCMVAYAQVDKSVSLDILENLARKFANPGAKITVDGNLTLIANSLVHMQRIKTDKPNLDTKTCIE